MARRRSARNRPDVTAPSKPDERFLARVVVCVRQSRDERLAHGVVIAVYLRPEAEGGPVTNVGIPVFGEFGQCRDGEVLVEAEVVGLLRFSYRCGRT